MGISSFYATVISPFLRKTVLGERIDMALISFKGNFQFAGFLYANNGSKIFADEEIEEIFAGLDRDSLEIAKRFMHRQHRCDPNSLMIYPKYFYTPAEQAEYKGMLKEFNRAIRRFHLPRHLVGPESLYYHHGLRFAPDFIKENIAGKLFGDVGGWLGDSAMVFSMYDPAKIVVFEPVAQNREKLKQLLQRNGIAAQNYELLPFALSDCSSSAEDFECRTLDELSCDNTTPFGVLKADIEGFGLRFLQGAKNTILRDRPLLTLSIYHNEEEFTGIYRTLKEWDIDYHYEIKSFSPLQSHGEVSIFAYPAEWRK